ncbi:MAG: response regulator transcription factor [Oscillospiraceae bacterium]|jgi:DNA-binding response OmpR family regulator|nr:response regulator transcription factor [Oscillospiraceae bacterium]
MKILVVDDEIKLVKGIKFNLENEGYQVDTGYDGEEAVAAARTGGYDLIILDVMMPRLGGLDACMQIREFSTVPIMMLTARSEDTDKIMGFEYGADEYITKPFNILVLKARIRALLRRSAITAPPPGSEAIRLGHVAVYPEERRATRFDEHVELTAKEFDLIELLAKNPGRVYSRDRLLDLVWSRDYLGDERTVDVHIRRLREKLEITPAEPALILTKWRAGYYARPRPADEK